jgi:anti-anti-sigma factor
MAIQDYSDNIILVDLPSEPQIRQELDTVMEIVRKRTDCDVVVDLSNVDILISISLSGFLQLYKLLTASGRRLVLCNTASTTKDIFRVTCFDGIFEFIDDKSEAVASLQPAEEPEPTG